MYSYISIMLVSFVINDDMWDFARLGQTKNWRLTFDPGFCVLSLRWVFFIVVNSLEAFVNLLIS